MTDYRSEKMDTFEGEGIARGRWLAYAETLPEGALDAAQEGWEVYCDALPDEERATMVGGAIGASELVGFWLAWHLGGGFAGLERAGWNRSTIFRKLRRFRLVYREHPDTYRFPWLKVDHRRAWDELTGELVDLGLAQHSSR